MKFSQVIFLLAIAGLMFCIVPIPGMPYRFSWQLASLWLGGVAFTAALSSWWWRAFWLLALIRTATIMPPDIEAYIMLLTIAVFLCAAEIASRIDTTVVKFHMRIAAMLLLAWMFIQELGWAPMQFDRPSGPFNPDACGIFLALCLPAFMCKRWCVMIPFVIWGLVVARSTTAILAALAGAGVYYYIICQSKKRFLAVCLALTLGLGIWFSHVKSLDQMIDNPRWLAWKHAVWSLRSEQWGRGLGSWSVVFPILASGEPELGEVKNENGKLVMNGVLAQAHNEPLQATFEMGLQMTALIAAFLMAIAVKVLKGNAPAGAAAGMAALVVGCLGFFTMHIAPTALLGCAWLGIWKRGQI